MGDTLQLEKLRAAGEKLLRQASTDAAVAARLEKDPAGEVAAAAGCPVPSGVTVKFVRDASGKINLVPSVDPALKGELDDNVLDAVSAGAKGYHKEQQERDAYQRNIPRR